MKADPFSMVRAMVSIAITATAIEPGLSSLKERYR